MKLLLYAGTDFICCANSGLDAACEVNGIDRGVVVETKVLEVAQCGMDEEEGGEYVVAYLGVGGGKVRVGFTGVEGDSAPFREGEEAVCVLEDAMDDLGGVSRDCMKTGISWISGTYDSAAMGAENQVLKSCDVSGRATELYQASHAAGMEEVLRVCDFEALKFRQRSISPSIVGAGWYVPRQLQVKRWHIVCLRKQTPWCLPEPSAAPEPPLGTDKD